MIVVLNLILFIQLNVTVFIEISINICLLTKVAGGSQRRIVKNKKKPKQDLKKLREGRFFLQKSFIICLLLVKHDRIYR